MSSDYAPPAPHPLTRHRTEAPWIDLLAHDESPKGRLSGVKAGSSLEFNVNAEIRGGGALEMAEVRGQEIDWINDRVRPWYSANGESWPLGTFLISAPVMRMTAKGPTRTVELMDKLVILTEQKVGSGHSVPAGTVVTNHVRTLIGWTGESAIEITDSPATLSSGMVWEPGTPLLRIINDLLSAVNYFSLWCDGWGRFRAEPYIRPGARTSIWDFTEGPTAIHLPDWDRDENIASVPNRVTLNSRSDEATVMLTSTVANTDPGSPYSIPSRRGRVLDHVENDVDAVDQATLDAMAMRRLIELTGAVSTLRVAHAPIPMALNDAVRFVSQGHTALATVQSWSLALETGANVQAVWREVVDL